MREILFRGKTDSGRWAFGSLILTDNYCCILESEDVAHPMDYPYLDNYLGTIDGRATPVIRDTVGQYTGFTDEIGIQIFEGDIVEIESHGYIPIKERGIVVFVDGCYGIKYVSNLDLKHDSDYVIFHRIGKVSHWQDMGASGEETFTYNSLGNVHDNPGLLGKAYDILMNKREDGDDDETDGD